MDQGTGGGGRGGGRGLVGIESSKLKSFGSMFAIILTKKDERANKMADLVVNKRVCVPDQQELDSFQAKVVPVTEAVAQEW